MRVPRALFAIVKKSTEIQATPHRAGGTDTQSDCTEMMPSKEFLCKMAENLQVDVPPSRQACFVRCCLNIIGQSFFSQREHA